MAEFKFQMNGKVYKIDANNQDEANEKIIAFKTELDGGQGEEKMGVVEDSARAFVSGVPKGVLGVAALPNMIERGVDWALERTTGYDISKPGERYTEALDYDKNKQRLNDVLKSTAGVELHEPETRVGKAFGTAGEFLGSAVVPGSGLYSTGGKLIKYGSRAANAAAKGVAAKTAQAAAKKVSQKAVEEATKKAIAKGGTALVPTTTQTAMTRVGQAIAPKASGQLAPLTPAVAAAAQKADTARRVASGASFARQQAGKELGKAAGRLGTSTAAPFVASEAAGQATYGTDYEPWARIAGGAVGSALPAMANRVRSPFMVKPKSMPGSKSDPQAVLKRLKAEGIDPTPGGLSRSEVIRRAEHVGGQVIGGKDMAEDVQKQFTVAALRKTGPELSNGQHLGIKLDIDDLTPDAVRAAISDQYDILGGLFDEAEKIGQVYKTPATKKIFDRLKDAYEFFGSQSADVPEFKSLAKELDQFKNMFDDGTLNGAAYTSLRRRLAAGKKYTDSQGARKVYGEALEALDDMVQESIKDSSFAGKFAEIRNSYKNLVTLDEAFQKAGPQKTGTISPADLQFPLKKRNQQTRLRTRNDLKQLTDDANQFMYTYQDSGTATRVGIQGGLTAAGALLVSGNPVAAAAVLVGGLGGPSLASQSFASKRVQNWLRNQSGANRAALLKELRKKYDWARGVGGATPGAEESEKGKAQKYRGNE